MKKLHLNSLFFQIICTIAAGTVCLVCLVSMILIRHSEEVYVESFSESKEKSFEQIDREFYNFHQDIADICRQISQSEKLAAFMSDGFENQIEERAAILSVNQLVEQTGCEEYTGLNVFAIGSSGKTYSFTRAERIAENRQEILDSSLYRRAVDNPKLIISAWLEEGLTQTTRREPVIAFAKALLPTGEETSSGAVFLTIREKDFQKMYSYFTSRTSDMLIFNRDEELLSTNNREWFDTERREEALEILHEMKKEDIRQLEKRDREGLKMYQIHRMRNTNYELLGIIEPEEAFAENYNIAAILLVTSAVTLIIALGILFFVRRETRPLYILSETMKKAGEGDLDAHVEVTGTEEVRRLSRTYNQMMEELKQYVEQIRVIEKEKRDAEIHALQMQINPHYMYNTLASIKWLAIQGNVKKTTAVIDAFISLLRNTISNTREFITVDEEIENLKNYVLITQTRYGDNVSVEYYIASRCRACKVPKLILQPFVENAFFHGFPEGRHGRIEISAKIEGEYLRFDIEDDGIGMTSRKLLDIKGKSGQKTEHFTGIGINNVDNRIKMIYGTDYGINIVSKEEQGTMITILLPMRGE